MRAALYLRVSTEEQANGGFSLDAQLNKLEGYCRLQKWEIAEVYREEGQSGRDTRRPQYERMMSESENWDVLLVYKIDRIHRNSKNFTAMLEELQEHGKEFCSFQDRFDTSTAMGRFARDVTERIAQLESEQTGERVKQAMDIKRAMGGIISRLPFGYTIKNGQATIEPDQAYTIRAIFKMKKQGFSDTDIASYLDRASVPTSNGKRWSKSTIYNIWKNPKYAGYDIRGGILIQSNTPAIVEREIFEDLNGPLNDKIMRR